MIVEKFWSDSTVKSHHVVDLEKSAQIDHFLVSLYEVLRSCGWGDRTIDRYLLIPGYNHTKNAEIVDHGKLAAKRRNKKK